MQVLDLRVVVDLQQVDCVVALAARIEGHVANEGLEAAGGQLRLDEGGIQGVCAFDGLYKHGDGGTRSFGVVRDLRLGSLVERCLELPVTKERATRV